MGTNSLSQASDLRKQGRFGEAAKIYDEVWQQQPDKFGEWDCLFYAMCLNKMKRYADALDHCRAMYKRFPNSNKVKQPYAQSIFYLHFLGTSDQPLQTLKKAAAAINELHPFSEPYSFAGPAILKLVKQMRSQVLIDWQGILDYLEPLDPQLLSERMSTVAMAGGKVVEYPSDKETWYAEIIRALAALGRNEDLIQKIEEAKLQQIKWHYNNHIWFDRKLAFAHAALGNKTKAEKILRELLMIKKDWFLVSDLAGVVQDAVEKHRLNCTAALLPGPPEMKINLYNNIANGLTDNEELAARHRLLSAKLRQENNWSLNPGQQQLLAESEGSSQSLIKELIPYWESVTGIEKHQGVIFKIHDNKMSGIIKSNAGTTYFFSMRSLRFAAGRAVPGVKVTFSLTDGFDKKRNAAVKNAVDIQASK